MLIKIFFALIIISASLAEVRPQISKYKLPASSGTRNLNTVSICELVEHPAKYQNKVVHMSAVYVVYMEGEFLFGADCNESKNYVDLAIPCKSEADEICEKVGEEFSDIVDPYLREDKFHWVKKANVVLLGRFRHIHKQERKGHLIIVRVSNLDFEFRLIRTESASPFIE